MKVERDWQMAGGSDIRRLFLVTSGGVELGVGCQSSAKCWLAAQPDKTGANNHLTGEWNALVP